MFACVLHLFASCYVTLRDKVVRHVTTIDVHGGVNTYDTVYAFNANTNYIHVCILQYRCICVPVRISSGFHALHAKKRKRVQRKREREREGE
mgnify:CR=1 FL=1